MRPNTGLGLSLSLLGLLGSSIPSVEAANKPKNAILLSEVQSLTLRANKQTTHRRVPSIPQLRCISPKAICRLHEIDTLRCVNQGSSYSSEDVEWACTATELPTTLRLGSTEVICEGYSSPDDPYVLRGSCGVEYRLVLTEEGERRFPELAGGGKKAWKLGGGAGDAENNDNDWSGYLFAILFFAVLAWIVYSACVAADGNNANNNNNVRRNGGGGGGGGGWGGGWGPGGGGGGGWDDPPPPYSKSTGDRQQGWRPGFWSGAATGAAAGYFAGSRGNNNTNNTRGYNNYGGGGSSFWGGGGGGPSSSRRNDHSSSSSGSGSSSGRHESTGFGSTSRR